MTFPARSGPGYRPGRTTLIAGASMALLLSGFLQAQAPAPTAPRQETAPNRLPVRRVVLYKSGVGYFEHLGRVRGNQNVTIDFTSGQLDDVLKSLTALDLDGGRVSGVSYNSEAGLDRRLGALRLPVGQQTTRAQFLAALRGARLEVRSGATRLIGRLLSVERVDRRADGTVTQVDVLSIVSDAGEIQTVALDPGVSVRIAESDLSDEVGKYLSLVASVRDQDLRRLTIATSGAGERDLYVSYVSEVPVWKSTYRLVLPNAADKRLPLLQGWAIVDNTVGEDWERVELSLVAGAPQSFVQSISQPYYMRRPVVPLPDRALLSPQTHQGAISAPAPASPPPPPPPPAAGPAGGRAAGGGGGGRGGAVGGVVGGLPSGSINMTIDGVTTPRTMQERVDAVQGSLQADATGAQLGDLFEYKLKEPVTIRKNQSALVPILGGEVGAEKVSLWNAASGQTRPLRAVWLTNTTGLTLDGGSFSVVEGQAFAGEGLLEPLKAGEKRLLSYAMDLGVLVDSKGETVPTRTTKVQVNRGVLIQQTEERQRRTYTARNEDTEPRLLVIEHPARAGWTLGGDVKPVETTTTWHRFRVPIAAKTSATVTVEEIRTLPTTIAINAVTDDQISVLVREQAISPSLEASLRGVLTRKANIARLSADIASRQGEVDTIARDQERVRENMRSLKGTSEEKQLLQRYVKQLDDQETRLDVVRRELQTLNAERQKAQDDLNKFIAELSGGN